MALAATGELSYNGYTFDAASHIKVDVEFVYDDDDRTIISHKHMFVVQAIVQDDTGLSMEVANLRQRLGESGKGFTFRGKGFGDDLQINTSFGGKRDTDNGPKPKLLSWEPIGDNKAAEIVWQCVVTTTVCKGLAKTKGIKSLSFGITFDINHKGETTRSIEGALTIAGLGVGRDTADRYRNKFKTPAIPGFRRTQSWSVSSDRSRLEFSIVDEEIGSNNPFYPGMVEMSGQHRVSWRRGPQGTQLGSTITAVIHPSAKLSPSQAWQVFLTMAGRRLRQARDVTGGILIDGYDIEEDLFTRSQSFRLTYRILSPIAKFVGSSGLFTPLGTNWNVWQVSLADTAFDQRGAAKLFDEPSNDIKFGLCEPADAVVVNNKFRGYVHKGGRPAKLKNEQPKAEDSWLYYQNDSEVFRECPSSRLPIIQDSTSDAGGWELDSSVPPSRPADYGTPPSNAKNDVIQQAGLPRYSIRIIGRAERAGHHIPRTVIMSVAGHNAVEISSQFKERVVGNFLGVPVYEAMWYADYMIAGSPGVVYPPEDHKDKVNSRDNVAIS